MTHKELTKGDLQGFASVCPGELHDCGSWPDEVLTPDGPRARVVSVASCRGCGKFVSAAWPEFGPPVVLNVYARAEPSRVVRDLAGALDARRAGK